jgi:hypothetical protein
MFHNTIRNTERSRGINETLKHSTVYA